MKLIIIVCFILIALPIAASANNADLRCGPYIISSGDTQSEVLEKCGQPSNIETWEEERIKRDFYRNIPVQSPEELSQEPGIKRDGSIKTVNKENRPVYSLKSGSPSLSF